MFYGATFAAAVNKKVGMCIGVDDFNEFKDASLVVIGGIGMRIVTEDQRKHIHAIAAAHGNGRVLFYEQPSLSVDPALILDKTGGVNVFLYDGDHSKEATIENISHYAPCLTDRAVLIVDDYALQEVEQGTQEGIAKAGFKVEDELLFAPCAGTQYGIYVAIIDRM